MPRGKHLAPRPHGRSRSRLTLAAALFGALSLVIPAGAAPGGTLLQLGTYNNSFNEFATTGFNGVADYECTVGADCATATFPARMTVPGFVGFEDSAVSSVTMGLNIDHALLGVVLTTDRAGSEDISIEVNIDGEVSTFTDSGATEGTWNPGPEQFNLGMIPPGSHTITFTVGALNGGNGAIAWDAITLSAVATSEAEVAVGGQLTHDGYKITVGGYLYDFGSEGGLVCDWNIRLHDVSVDALDGSGFTADTCSQLTTFAPGPAEGVVNLTAVTDDGYELLLRLEDRGEPNHGQDTIRIEISDAGGVVYDTSPAAGAPGGDFPSVSDNVGTARTDFDRGNIQIDY